MTKRRHDCTAAVCGLLERVRDEEPLVHHLTNWVTISDCANAVKALGASPVMAHAHEEVADMAAMAGALVLNIGTLTAGVVEAMKRAGASANRKGIPVILDPCGAGATAFRDRKSRELLDGVRIDILKGNASEMARLAGRSVRTKGVDSAAVAGDLRRLAAGLAREIDGTAVVTGERDIVAGRGALYVVGNGHPMMGRVVGTGCMAASVIGAFAAVAGDRTFAAAAGLACYGIAAEYAAEKSRGPASFKTALIDELFRMDRKRISGRLRVESIRTGRC